MRWDMTGELASVTRPLSQSSAIFCAIMSRIVWESSCGSAHLKSHRRESPHALSALLLLVSSRINFEAISTSRWAVVM